MSRPDLATRVARDVERIAAKLVPQNTYTVGGLKRLLGGWRLARYGQRHHFNQAAAVELLAARLVEQGRLEPAHPTRLGGQRWRALDT